MLFRSAGVEALDGEGFAADEDDEDLEGDHDDVDANEEVVVLDTLEDVELVVKAAVAVAC